MALLTRKTAESDDESFIPSLMDAWGSPSYSWFAPFFLRIAGILIRLD